MDLLRPIIKHFTYDFYIRRDGYKIGEYRRQLEASQFYPDDRMAAQRIERIRRMLQFCYDKNKFYRKRFRETGFTPGDFKDLSDLKKVPVLTKNDIRDAGDGLFSEGYSRENTVHKRTGGSTGVPLHTYMNFEAASFKKAAAMRHNTWANFVPGARLGAIWGDTDRRVSLKGKIRNILTDRTVYLDTLKFDEEHIERFLRQIRAVRPQILMGHAHSVFRLAEYVRDNNKGDFTFKGIITTAMVLPESERKVIEEVFDSPIFNRYGCEELSIIASECEAHRGMHIFAEGLHLEFAGDDKDIFRPLIITDLANFAMPLIRYEIGDFAVDMPGRCPCGRTLPRLKEVSGRTADFLYTPDRKPVFGISILDTFVIHIPGFKQVQIIQDAYDHLNFRIVKDDKFSPESIELLRKNIAEIFGDKMGYEVEFVKHIELSGRGKYRFSICRIDMSRTRR